jgi:hypothetical protein
MSRGQPPVITPRGVMRLCRSGRTLLIAGQAGRLDERYGTMTLRPDRWRVVAAALVTGLLLAACSSSSTSSPAAATASAVCQAAADLHASVNTLAHVKIGAGTAEEITADLADVQAKFTALTEELRGSHKTQTDAVKSALDTLKTAVSDLSAHPSTSTVKEVATAVGGVTTAVGNLLTALAPECGSASASPSS